MKCLKKEQYLQGEVFAHAIGYMNPIYGLAGLEKKYDAELMGHADTVVSKFVFFSKENEEKVGNGLQNYS